MINRDGTWLGR